MRGVEQRLSLLQVWSLEGRISVPKSLRKKAPPPAPTFVDLGATHEQIYPVMFVHVKGEGSALGKV